MQLFVIFSGIPGTGKSTLAEHATRQLDAVLFSKDVIEAALWRSGVGAAQKSGWAAYEVMTALAAQQLRRGGSVVLDSVAGTQSIRATWLELAADLGVVVRAVECVLADQTTHRARVQGRQRGIPGWPELSWDDVERVRAGFEPWQQQRLVLDASSPLDETLKALVAYLAQPSGRAAGVSALADWNFCAMCGTRLVASAGPDLKPACPDCGWFHRPTRCR